MIPEKFPDQIKYARRIKMKKVISLIICLVLLVSMMAGCSSGGGAKQPEDSNNTPNANEKIELRYARWGLPEEMNATKKMLDEFTKLHPNITVKLENASWDEYWQRLQTQMASNTAPDVFLLDAGWYLNQFAPKGVITDITPLMEKDNISKDQYYDVWRTFTYDDKIYAMPRDYNSVLLFYNKDLFKKAGISEYPNPDMTWEQLVPIAQKLTIDKNGKNATEPGFDPNNIVQYGLQINTADIDSAIETLIYQNGGKLFSEDGKTFYIDTPEARQVLEFLHDAIWKYHIKPSPASAAKLTSAWFQSGTYAMVYQGTWMMSTLSDAKFDWDITVPPTFKDKIYCVQSVGNAISSKTKYPEAAWELVKFLSGKEGQTIMANQNDAIPVLKEVAENVYMTSKSKPDNKKAIFDAAVKSTPYIDFPQKAQIFEAINSKLELYFNNQKSLDDTIKELKADVANIQSQQ